MNAHAVNEETLVVSGIDREIPVATLKVWGEDIAEITEATIAEDFADEMAAGKPLAPVSDAHEQRKARDGLDPRHGHMTGELQDQLDAGGFARVTASPGRITVKFDEGILHSRYDVSEWYAESKVHGGRILTVLPKHAKAAQSYVSDRVADYKRGQARKRRSA